MLEKYYKYKIENKEFIVMIKFGNFYEMFDKDAVIASKLLGYKLSKISDTVKCGFPISSLEKVLKKLNIENVNYVVIENDKIIIKKEFDKNIYTTFDFDINNIKYNFIRISKITKYLNDNAYAEMNEFLGKIESLINGRG